MLQSMRLVQPTVNNMRMWSLGRLNICNGSGLVWVVEYPLIQARVMLRQSGS
jgi:hypothetical protein